MQAIIEVGGGQHQVKKGQKIKINLLASDVGDTIEFEPLAIYGDQVKIGQPKVKGAKVVAKVLEHGRGKKVFVETYKRRKGYHKSRGHRQELTTLEITDIVG